MTATFRQTQILDIARREGRVLVEPLAAEFGVTLQTIRRDLTEMAADGLVTRVHGGAVPATPAANIAYEERRQLNNAAKAAIATAAAARIPNGCTLFLNIGTTTEAVARALANHQDLLVVTNNMNVAQILTTHPSCDVVVTGGQLRRADMALVGPLAVDTIRQFRFDIAVIGCSALGADGDILDFDLSEIEVSRAILDRAHSAYLVADSSKQDRRAPARIAALSGVDGWITDTAPAPELSQACAKWSTEVIVAA